MNSGTGSAPSMSTWWLARWSVNWPGPQPTSMIGPETALTHASTVSRSLAAVRAQGS